MTDIRNLGTLRENFKINSALHMLTDFLSIIL